MWPRSGQRSPVPVALYESGSGPYGGLSRRRLALRALRAGTSIMSSRLSLRAEMAEIAAAAGSVERRADALLGSLRGLIPYAAAWIAVRDPETRIHRRVGSDGDTDALARYFALPEADDELEALGLNRFQPPVPASALPVPLAQTRAWAEYLLPAGFNDGVAMAIF